MKRIGLLVSAILVSAVSLATATDMQTRVAESRAVTAEFMQSLKGALQEAMKAGGPVNAIKVCKVTAPEIAEQQSKKHGWNVGRTSLKLRNPENAPDAWERESLQSFEKRRAAGEDISNMERSEVVNEEGQTRFRYMKAIPTADLCTKCHGSDIEPAVQAELDAAYPEDKARGFKPGDIRGAFTIIQPM